MSVRAWALVVTIGLTFLPSSGSAQDDEQEADRPATEQQQPPQILPIPLPVQIIESEETAVSRETGEAESRQRETEDLVAQQGMNAATQAMNDATQRMADYALWSTVFVAAGTVLLFWTLSLTRQANRAAREAVQVTRRLGVAQMRAYVTAAPTPIWVFPVNEQDPVALRIVYDVSNFGNTPARGVAVETGQGEIIAGAVDFDPKTVAVPFDVGMGVGPPGKSFLKINYNFPISNIRAMMAGGRSGVCYVKVTYSDIFGRGDLWTEACCEFRVLLVPKVNDEKAKTASVEINSYPRHNDQDAKEAETWETGALAT